MGFRSLIIVQNDRLSEIANDNDFGAKMATAALCSSRSLDSLGYPFTVQEVCHADNVSLMLVDGYRAKVLAGTSSMSVGSTDPDEIEMYLLRQLAGKHGFRLVKKTKGPK